MVNIILIVIVVVVKVTQTMLVKLLGTNSHGPLQGLPTPRAM